MHNGREEDWHAIRRKGQARYVLLRGLLKWGGCVGTIGFMLAYVVEFGFSLHPLDTEKARRLLVLSTVSGAIFGLGMGAWSWRWNERNYRSVGENRPPASGPTRRGSMPAR